MVLAQRLRARWLQIVTHVGALVSLALLIWDYTQHRLGFEPIREITLRTGRYALILLILSLACTPIDEILGRKLMLRVRRALGLYAFLYLSLHLLTVMGVDYGFNLALIVRAVLEKRFVQVGLVTYLILLPLAITSTRGWIRRLGKNWKRLHRLVYLAALLDVVHFVWVVKAGNPRPLPFAAVLALLLIVRIPAVRRAIVRLRERLSSKKGKGAAQ